MNTTLPEKQHAVQLVGPGELKLNPAKAVTKPGPHEILIKVEACGLCFSDLKLLKQFNTHARKSEVVGGLTPDVLKGIQSYVPGNKPVVPGHEVVCRIIAVGDKVAKHKVGERCLVQTDYRDLPTASSNAAFGYNFEGGLQEYCIIDERVAIDSRGDRFLIPVGEEKSASAVALVEPWACVEDSYVNKERQTVKTGGKMLVVTEAGHKAEGIDQITSKNKPASVQNVDPSKVAELPNEGFDDIVYFGASKATIETLNDKLAPRGLMNIVLGGQKIGGKVNTGVGRVHYGMTRWIGTTGSNAADSYKIIPATTEIRPNDSIIVIGAGGPMGQMHIIRNICAGIPGISQVGTDMDDPRLNSLGAKANALATANKTPLKLVNTSKEKITEKFTYWALMAPVPALVDQAIAGSKPGGIINIFAGIPAPTKHELDLDTYIANRLYMFGTSGSVIEDMKIVLRKVETGQLDTNTSLDAISGMAGAMDGIKAIENRTLAGKIIVYPMLHDVPLTPLSELNKSFPTVAAKLKNGQWNKDAEKELLKVAAK
ncbi:MAG TPA: alcohol dehydrogenase catalytic domain-containing protein [Tepidisphaeraceae bacterium]|nr:alcohol dehydrogenase catalytic domain-containing protein [Tepidisphaeraceae bacterium]